GTNQWTINAENSGQIQQSGASTVTLFENISNLIGGENSDSFEIVTGGTITGRIDGGGGLDELTVTDESLLSVSWNLSAEKSITGIVSSFSGVESLVGGPAGDSFYIADASEITSIRGGGGSNSAS